jgi:hypothetical protein
VARTAVPDRQAHIGPDAVGNAEIATDSVTTPTLANNAVTSSEIADEQITSADLRFSSVGASELRFINTIVSPHVTVDAGRSGTARATCRPGELLISGGHE